MKNKKKRNSIAIGIAMAFLMLTAVGCALVKDTASYIQKGDLEQAWSKAKTDEDKQLVISAYLADGNYEEAYKKALNDEDKQNVEVENLFAVLSADFAGVFLDSSSFVLTDGFYDEKDGDVVLSADGTDGSGAMGSAFALYHINTQTKEIETSDFVSDLAEADRLESDDLETSAEKWAEGWLKKEIKGVMADAKIQLSDESIGRINALSEKGKLNGVTFIEGAGETNDDGGETNVAN